MLKKKDKTYAMGSVTPDDARYRERAAATRRNMERRNLLREEKSKPCTDCGQVFDPVCMDFDHRPGKAKAKAVSQLRQYGIETLRAEIAKCDLVCANCHRLRTKNRGRHPNFGKRTDLEPARIRAREVVQTMTELVIRECAGVRW